MDLLGNELRQKFRDTMKSAHDTFNKKVIIWRRLKSRMNVNGEDNTINGYDNISLSVLINYNYMRSWPITNRTESGDLDRQSMQILINKDYLRDLGYLNADGYFQYDPSQDRFVIDGLVHQPMGDTPTSQNGEDDILCTLVVKREEAITPNKQ